MLGATPLADHHGVPWAGPALIVLAVKSPLADLHGAYAPCAGRGHLSGWALVRQGEWSTQRPPLGQPWCCVCCVAGVLSIAQLKNPKLGFGFRTVNTLQAALALP